MGNWRYFTTISGVFALLLISGGPSHGHLSPQNPACGMAMAFKVKGRYTKATSKERQATTDSVENPQSFTWVALFFRKDVLNDGSYRKCLVS